LLKVRLAGPALVAIVFFVATALFAPFIAPYDPAEQDVDHNLEGPSWAHPLGTDLFGRDTLSRLIFGTRVSLQVGIAAMGFAVVFGVPLGLMAGYRGGLTDDIIMRLMDALYAFPPLILALAIVALLGPGAVQVTSAIGVVYVPLFARLIRASVLSIREMDYVVAARALGANGPRIAFRHILPNGTAPLIVQGTLGLGWAILVEASLSFLGVGVPPPTPTWGLMLNEGFQFIETVPWLSIFPGVAIFVLVLSFNLVGDALRDVLDPRLGRALGLR
jgi:peptide/nickel transport system permease protein